MVLDVQPAHKAGFTLRVVYEWPGGIMTCVVGGGGVQWLADPGALEVRWALMCMQVKTNLISF